MVTDEIPETELNGEMFCYKREKNFHEELKKNGNMKYFMTPKGHRVIRGHCDLLYDPKRSGSLVVALTYFMTPKVTVNFVVSLTLFMTPKGDGVIRGRRDLLYDPKGHGELFGQFDLVIDPRRSRGH